MADSCMPVVELTCGGAWVERHPCRVTIAATQDNRALLEEFPQNKWKIVEEGESNIVVEFATRKDRVRIYSVLVMRSKQLWAY